MTLLTAFARIEAAAAGRALPIRTVRHAHLGRRPLVVIPLQLAGEACAPLAVMLGDDPDKPRLLTVYEPRDRTRRFEFAADLAEVILGHLDGYLTADDAGATDPQTGTRSPAGTGVNQDRAPAPEPLPDAPQLLVPNPAAAAFLGLLGRSTRLRRTDGEYAVRPTVPLLGRWLTHYAERAEVPGSVLLLPMTTALAEHWATGQSDLEDANLAALLGWIDPPDGLTGQQAARLAEDPVRCPPAGPVTDPTFDNEVLEGRMAAIRDATLAGDGPALTRAQAAMDAALRSQLAPTWELMWRAHALLTALPEADHAQRRWTDDRRSFTAQAAWLREGGAPQPRRDSAVAAAKRLARLEREQQRLAVERAHDDPLVMAEYRLTGDAFAGLVVQADLTRLDTEGRKAKLRPWLTVATTDAVIVEPGTPLACPDYPGQTARVVHVTTASQNDDDAATDDDNGHATDDNGHASDHDGHASDHDGHASDHDDHTDANDYVTANPGAGVTLVTLELSGGMGRALAAPPGTTPALGDEVTYTTLRDDFQPAPQFPSREETPWTHGGPPLEYVPTDDDAQEPWS